MPSLSWIFAYGMFSTDTIALVQNDDMSYLDIVNGVRRFDLKSDGLAREGLYEDLHCRGNQLPSHQVTRGARIRDGVLAAGCVGIDVFDIGGGCRRCPVSAMIVRSLPLAVYLTSCR